MKRIQCKMGLFTGMYLVCVARGILVSGVLFLAAELLCEASGKAVRDFCDWQSREGKSCLPYFL